MVQVTHCVVVIKIRWRFDFDHTRSNAAVLKIKMKYDYDFQQWLEFNLYSNWFSLPVVAADTFGFGAKTIDVRVTHFGGTSFWMIHLAKLHPSLIHKLFFSQIDFLSLPLEDKLELRCRQLR